MFSRAAVKYSINELWRFHAGDGQNMRLRSYDDSQWDIVNLPHTWNDKDAVDDAPGYYRGIGWYRKSLFIDSTVKDKVTILYFDGANEVTELYVNERFVGIHKGGYTRFSFDISHYITPGANNLIAIKVDNSHNMSIPPLSADYTFFGGIYRNLYLVVKDKSALSVGDFGSDGVYIKTPSVSAEKAVVEIQTLIDNGLDRKRRVEVVRTIIGPDGKEMPVATQQELLGPHSVGTVCTKQITISDPRLWSPDTPRLYTVKTVLMDAQTRQELDRQLNTFGLRWYRFDPESGFSLNGRHLKLIGASRHQCYLDKGNALPDELHVEDVRLLKEMGGNMLRVSHYPQDPLILEMCDKLGIIASVEVPIVNEITESEEFLQNSLYMTTEMVKQNFNHPSVVIWAYMNEVMLRPPVSNDSMRLKRYCREVCRQAMAIDGLIRSLDAERYTMIPFHGSLKRYEEADLVHVPMIVGWNLYQGWYGGNFADFDRFVEGFHARYPAIPTLITEYGADVDDRLHSFTPERFDLTVEYGDLYHEHYLQTIFRNKYISGGVIWNLSDFYSEGRGDAVPHVNTKGITTLDRQLKNTYLLYKVALSKEPMAYIGSKSWKYRGGMDKGDGSCLQPVKIYSNQPKVDIYHNGGVFRRVEVPDHFLDVEVPFTNGENTIELRIGDKVYDRAEMNFCLLPADLPHHEIRELNVMLGSNRYFEDRDARMVWIPEQPYRPGSWGYIGGRAVRPTAKSGTLPSSPLNIINTTDDPIFQTQREDIRAFRFDVADGQYAVYLYWADLSADSMAAPVYNLGNNAVGSGKESSVMNVSVNDRPVFSHFEVTGPYAIVKKVLVDVTDKKGLTVNLDAVKGKSILNAIRILKLN